MKLRSLFLCLSALLSTAPAAAAELRTAPMAVIELFTSEGCSSCPPADAILSEVGARQDVIALAYHVDYWDYIGWRDTFGSASFSDYQRAYAAARGKMRIYTPQLMVNGIKDVVGSKRGEIEAAIAEAKLPVALTLVEKDDMISASAEGQAGLPPAHVWLVTYKDSASVPVERGENRGKVLDYSHIVTSRQIIGMWDPKDGASIKLPMSDLLGNTSDGVAVIIQEDKKGHPGRILGGASFLR